MRFGFITIFLSDALISGFTTGAAFHIATSQVKHLVGMDIPRADTSGFFSLFKVCVRVYVFSYNGIVLIQMSKYKEVLEKIKEKGKGKIGKSRLKRLWSVYLMHN